MQRVSRATIGSCGAARGGILLHGNSANDHEQRRSRIKECHDYRTPGYRPTIDQDTYCSKLRSNLQHLLSSHSPHTFNELNDLKAHPSQVSIGKLSFFLLEHRQAPNSIVHIRFRTSEAILRIIGLDVYG